jgi:hypothetical protein
MTKKNGSFLTASTYVLTMVVTCILFDKTYSMGSLFGMKVMIKGECPDEISKNGNKERVLNHLNHKLLRQNINPSKMNEEEKRIYEYEQ